MTKYNSSDFFKMAGIKASIDIETYERDMKEKEKELDKYKNIIENIETLVRNQLYGAFVPTGRTDGKVLQEIERKIEELKGE